MDQQQYTQLMREIHEIKTILERAFPPRLPYTEDTVIESADKVHLKQREHVTCARCGRVYIGRGGHPNARHITNVVFFGGETARSCANCARAAIGMNSVEAWKESWKGEQP